MAEAALAVKVVKGMLGQLSSLFHFVSVLDGSSILLKILLLESMVYFLLYQLINNWIKLVLML